MAKHTGAADFSAARSPRARPRAGKKALLVARAPVARRERQPPTSAPGRRAVGPERAHLDVERVHRRRPRRPPPHHARRHRARVRVRALAAVVERGGAEFEGVRGVAFAAGARLSWRRFRPPPRHAARQSASARSQPPASAQSAASASAAQSSDATSRCECARHHLDQRAVARQRFQEEHVDAELAARRAAQNRGAAEEIGVERAEAAGHDDGDVGRAHTSHSFGECVIVHTRRFTPQDFRENALRPRRRRRPAARGARPSAARAAPPPRRAAARLRAGGGGCGSITDPRVLCGVERARHGRGVRASSPRTASTTTRSTTARSPGRRR